jgi:hypothetical protein
LRSEHDNNPRSASSEALTQQNFRTFIAEFERGIQAPCILREFGLSLLSFCRSWSPPWSEVLSVPCTMQFQCPVKRMFQELPLVSPKTLSRSEALVGLQKRKQQQLEAIRKRVRTRKLLSLQIGWRLEDRPQQDPALLAIDRPESNDEQRTRHGRCSGLALQAGI